MQNNLNIAPVLAAYAALSEQYTAILETFSQEQINSSPTVHSWTPAQVVQHIVKANNSSFLGAPGQKLDRPVDQMIPELESNFLNFEVKMISPDFLLPESKEVSKQECIVSIQSAFKTLSEQLPTARLDLILKWPLGLITKWEVANFIIYHSKRHLHQLEQLKKQLS